MDVLERVGSSRMMLDGKFPYPSAIDCMRYSLQEMCEYDDAMMRQEQPDHKRNNGREHDPRKELGQAMYMLLSAGVLLDFTVGRPRKEERPRLKAYTLAIREMCVCLDYIVTNVRSSAAWSFNETYALLCIIASSHGWDVAQLIEDTCADFERKHLEPVGPDMRHGGHTA